MPKTQAVIAEPQGPIFPAYPILLGNDEPSPLQFADPVQTDWSSPSSTGYDGPPDDDYFNTISNPANPGPWNIDGSQQDPGVAYNHDDNQTVEFSGTGSMGWITEWENNMGGLDAVTASVGRDIGASQLSQDARYQGSPMTPDEGSDQYIVWSEPLDGAPASVSAGPLLTKFIPWLG